MYHILTGYFSIEGLPRQTDPMRTACAALALVVAGRPSLAKIASIADKSPPDYINLHAMRGLQTSSDSSEDEVGISGVLWLLTTDALEACTEKCEDGLAKAFNTTEEVGCFCPDASESARRLVYEPFPSAVGDFLLPDKKKHVSANKRWLRGLSELEETLGAAFALRIKGQLSDAAKALGLLSTTGLEKVASEFDVQESEVGPTLRFSQRGHSVWSNRQWANYFLTIPIQYSKPNHKQSKMSGTCAGVFICIN